MTLPTRERATEIAGTWAPDGPVGRLIHAYADGDLLTRAEWEATIDYEAMADHLGKSLVVFAEHSATTMGLLRESLDAALGGDDGTTPE